MNGLPGAQTFLTLGVAALLLDERVDPAMLGFAVPTVS